jgi:hypothetical protein
MKKMLSLNNCLFDVAGGAVVFGLLGILSIAVFVIGLIVVAIVLIVRARRKRNASAAAALKGQNKL